MNIWVCVKHWKKLVNISFFLQQDDCGSKPLESILHIDFIFACSMFQEFWDSPSCISSVYLFPVTFSEEFMDRVSVAICVFHGRLPSAVFEKKLTRVEFRVSCCGLFTYSDQGDANQDQAFLVKVQTSPPKVSGGYLWIFGGVWKICGCLNFPNLRSSRQNKQRWIDTWPEFLTAGHTLIPIRGRGILHLALYRKEPQFGAGSNRFYKF